MSEIGIPQLVGAVMGAIIAVTIAGIIRLLSGDQDADF
jgi:hypothetical protein